MNEEQLRALAGEWHDGEGSELYNFSIGRDIEDPISALEEIRGCLTLAPISHPTDVSSLQELAKYIESLTGQVEEQEGELVMESVAKVIEYKGRRYFLESVEEKVPETIMFEGTVFKLKGKAPKQSLQESEIAKAPKQILVGGKLFTLSESQGI